jgi:hypothetical protein
MPQQLLGLTPGLVSIDSLFGTNQGLSTPLVSL